MKELGVSGTIACGLALIGSLVFVVVAVVVAAGSLQFAYDAGAALTDAKGAYLTGSQMLAALDAAKIACIVALPFLVKSGDRLRVWLAVACLLVGTLFSLYGSYRAQIIAYAQADALEAKVRGDFADIDRGIAELERRLAFPEYVDATSEQQVRDQMARFETNPKFALSRGCTMKPSPAGAIGFCDQYNGFLPKLTAAKEADKMRAELRDLRTNRAGHEAVSTKNAEVKAIAEALGVSLNAAYLVRSAAFALGFEIASGALFSIAIGCLMMALGRLGRGGAVAASDTSQESFEKSSSEPADAPSERPSAKSSERPSDGNPPKGPKSPPKGGGRKPSETPAKTGRSEGPRLTLVRSSAKPSELSVEQYLKTVSARPGSAHRFGGLKEGYIGWCGSEGATPVADNKLGPAIEAAGFEKKKGIGGLMVYIDCRRAEAETA